MGTKVTIIEVPVAGSPAGQIETPIALLTPMEVAFQQDAFQSDAFQMSPVSVSGATYTTKVTIIEIVG